AAFHLARAEARAEQLRPGDEAVLAGRQPGDQLLLGASHRAILREAGFVDACVARAEMLRSAARAVAAARKRYVMRRCVLRVVSLRGAHRCRGARIVAAAGRAPLPPLVARRRRGRTSPPRLRIAAAGRASLPWSRIAAAAAPHGPCSPPAVGVNPAREA